MLDSRPAAQSLSLPLFERYLESLRTEAGIPGLSAAVLQNGVIVWEQGFGRRDVESGAPATADTPYVLGDTSQALVGTLLLKKCVDESYLDLSDRVAAWSPQFPEPSATIRDVLTHAVAPGVFRYDVRRFSRLTGVVEACSGGPFAEVLVHDVFERLGMSRSSPTYALDALPADERSALGPARLNHYAGLLRELATPYRVDARSGAASRTTPAAAPVPASSAVVTTVRDWARFDAALDALALLDRPTRDLAWRQATPLPTGLGWFVQAYNNELIVWQFGTVPEAYSSLVLKVPNRRLTLVLLANSDGLNAPFGLERGDITASLFARLFLRLMVV